MKENIMDILDHADASDVGWISDGIVPARIGALAKRRIIKKATGKSGARRTYRAIAASAALAVVIVGALITTSVKRNPVSQETSRPADVSFSLGEYGAGFVGANDTVEKSDDSGLISSVPELPPDGLRVFGSGDDVYFYFTLYTPEKHRGIWKLSNGKAEAIELQDNRIWYLYDSPHPDGDGGMLYLCRVHGCCIDKNDIEYGIKRFDPSTGQSEFVLALDHYAADFDYYNGVLYYADRGDGPCIRIMTADTQTGKIGILGQTRLLEVNGISACERGVAVSGSIYDDRGHVVFISSDGEVTEVKTGDTPDVVEETYHHYADEREDLVIYRRETHVGSGVVCDGGRLYTFYGHSLQSNGDSAFFSEGLYIYSEDGSEEFYYQNDEGYCFIGTFSDKISVYGGRVVAEKDGAVWLLDPLSGNAEKIADGVFTLSGSEENGYFPHLIFSSAVFEGKLYVFDYSTDILYVYDGEITKSVSLS